MKDFDDILRLKTTLDSTNVVEQLARAIPPSTASVWKLSQEMELASMMERARAQIVTNSIVASMIRPSAASILQAMPRFDWDPQGLAPKYTIDPQVIAGAAQSIASFHDSIATLAQEFRAKCDTALKSIQELKIAHNYAWTSEMRVAAGQIAAIGQINFEIPALATSRWPADMVVERLPLLEDCVLNTAALGIFQAASIEAASFHSPTHLSIASDFVRGHVEVVRRLPPGLGDSEHEDNRMRDHCEEGIGAKLETLLSGVDPRLVSLRRRSWSNLSGGDAAGARLAMVGIRELFDEVFRRVAPHSAVQKTPQFENRVDRTVTRPTRRMRLAYALGEERAAELDSILQFSSSVERTQQFVHTFAEDVELVRVQMSNFENWIFLLLHYGSARSS
ncbi:hypothetical protein Acid345_4283 [Candidatus Koribacter versatilis Ellin345]|uniref:Predicted pPIWI-associating nuclease domain-containing protein n=1 Tax=Koribacter versatilis (strain Ellin345) TaxID=204669 RepID=Q1IIL7_KORVE|nr:hypothetical protein [Candidatus Koribacter versatilis]ABF43283.1 hypothetical protein Acid345_4283 [Candidatus Koribacter versatilis Ellin345]